MCVGLQQIDIARNNDRRNLRFLVKSADRAILHTGDIRADGLFLQSLRRNPAVQEFIGPWSAMGQQREGVRRVLDRIYVDTGAVWAMRSWRGIWLMTHRLGTGDMPDKASYMLRLP